MPELNADFTVLQQIADLSAEGVIIYSLPEKKLVYSNRIASQLLGVHEGSSVADIEAVFAKIASADREYIKNKLSAVVTRSVTAEVEFRIAAVGDDDICLCCTAYLVANETAIVVYIRDITKPKAHEAYLVEYGARKNTLLDTLTHHMSGALNLMRNLAAEAEKHIGTTSDKNLRVYLDLLKANNTYCLEIINDLLKNEHEQSPHIFVKNARIDIVERISIIYDELQQSYKNRTFLLEHSVDSLHINTDEVKLLQIVNNLASNAIKFSAQDKPITIAISETANDVVISVTDQGIGIPPVLRPGIFKRQAGTGRTGLNGERSIGLGLSICKNLSEVMGGKVWFESTEQEGSTFYLSLPKP